MLDGGINCIQIGSVECLSASHDALDKTLLPPSTFSKEAIALEKKEKQ